MGGVAHAAPGAGATAAAPASRSGLPVIADEWLQLDYVATKKGPRLCPLGTAVNTSSLTRPCGKDAELVSIEEYLTAFLATCPGSSIVSVHPIALKWNIFVIGYSTPQNGSCAAPAGARKL